jgi:hypothetical protein
MIISARRSRNSALAAVLAVVAGLGNPAVVACSPQDDEYQFDANDMAAAIEGRFAGDIDGKAVTLQLQRSDEDDNTTVERSLRTTLEAGKTRALKCGNRSFVKAASACISTTTLSVNAVVMSESDLLPAGTLPGWFTVWGNNLKSGDLTFDGNASHLLDATFRDGVLSDWMLTKPDGTSIKLNLERVE